MGYRRRDETVIGVGSPVYPPFGIGDLRNECDDLAITGSELGKPLDAYRFRPGDLLGTALKAPKPELHDGGLVL